MKLEINQAELNKALKLAKKSVGKSSAVVNITEYLKMEANQDTNELVITSTDLKTRTEVAVNAEIEEGGVLLVKNKTFAQYVNSFNKKDTLSFTEKNNDLEIKCNGSDFTFNTVSPDEFPEEREFAEDSSKLKTFETSLENLKNAINITSFACSNKDDLRPSLTGVYFHQVDGQLNLVGTDTYRLALNKTGIDCYRDIEAIIPIKPLDIVSQLDADEVKITLQDDELIRFITDEATISSRLIAGNYVNYNTVIPDDHKTSFKANLKELKTSLKRTNIIARIDDGVITLSTNENEITFTAQNDSGDVKENVDIENFEGPEQKISFDASYLIDVVKKLDADKIRFELQKETQPIVVKAIEEVKEDGEVKGEIIKDYTYLIMPIRPH
jgi:DNA polymerase-3 subunit beta